MNGKSKAKPTILNPRRLKPGTSPRQTLPKIGNKTPKKELLPKKIGTPSKRELMPLRGKAAIDAYQKSITPKGMAKTKAEQTKAQDALMVKRYGKKK
jgi:hypothetical protein